MSEHHHEHHGCSCGCNCGCGHDHHHDHHEKDESRELIEIVIGVVLFVIGLCLKNFTWQVSFLVFLAAYILMGREILRSAARGIGKGHLLDENFLMSIATLAAFVIGDYAEAVGVLLFYRIGEFFEHKAVEKSRKQIMEAVDLRPESVHVVREDGEHIVLAQDVHVGEIVQVRVGDRIPLDGVVTEGKSRVDMSAITGEAIPVAIAVGAPVLSGGMNVAGVINIRVEKRLEDSMVSRILHSVEHATTTKPKIDRFITRFAKIYTPFVVILAILTAVIPSIFTGEWQKWIYTAITFLVISCPCALVLSVPLAFFSGIGLGSKKGILFKSGLAMETLRQVQTVIMDKTGTLTKGEFSVQECISYGQYERDEILRLAASCEQQSNHPIASSLVAEAQNKSIPLKDVEQLQEFAGKGISGFLDGKKVLCGNEILLEEQGFVIPNIENIKHGTKVFVAYDREVVGCVVISDCLKTDSKETIIELKRRKMKTVMLTGDTENSATIIAKDAGIEEVYAGLLPDEKLERLQNIRNQYGKVMYVGDGINDAPVLAGADVGAAMGSGADAAIEVADIVFMTSSMQAIPEAMKLADITNAIAIQNVIFALGIKTFVMILGLLGYANMWMAVFADTGVAMLCVLNSIRILRRK